MNSKGIGKSKERERKKDSISAFLLFPKCCLFSVSDVTVFGPLKMTQDTTEKF